MTRKEITQRATKLLENWDPFDHDHFTYMDEIIQVVEVLHELDHPADLAKKIREIYAHSFTIWIPIEKCVQISYQLLAIKYEALSIV